MPQVIANGRSLEAPVPCSIDVLLQHLGQMPRSVVVELNGEAVPPSQFDARTVQDGDRLEIVRIVAGG